MKKWCFNLFILAGVSLISGCVSIHSHQTGRTSGKGVHRGFGGFNMGKLNSEIYTGGGLINNFYLFEIGDSYGVTENLDLGARLNSSMYLTIQGKFQYLGNKESFLASSLGVEVGGAPFSLLYGVVNYGGAVSLFNSIHLNEEMAFTFSPRYIYYDYNSYLEVEEHFEHRIYGFSAGMIIGKENKISIEVSSFSNNSPFSDFGQYQQYSIGYIFLVK